MEKAWETGDLHTGYWWGNLKEGVHLENPGVNGSTTLKCIPKMWGSGHGLN